jgi:hypothetical protein
MTPAATSRIGKATPDREAIKATKANAASRKTNICRPASMRAPFSPAPDAPRDRRRYGRAYSLRSATSSIL